MLENDKHLHPYFMGNEPSVDCQCDYLNYYIPKQMITGIGNLKSSVFTFCLVCQSKQMVNSKQLSHLLGYTATHEKDDESLYQVRRHIYPSDYAFSIQSERLGLAFWNSLPFNEQRKFVFVYQSRLVNSVGKVVLFTHKSTVLRNNNQNIVCCVLIESAPFATDNSSGKPLRFMLHCETKKCYSIEPQDNKKAFYLLTPAELNVLQLIAEGKSNAQIADKLFISINTIKTHRKHIVSSTNTLRITQSLTFAQLLNLIH